MAYWLDDGFDSWPEVVRVGSAATGLYVRCGSWIARNTQDGFVPAEIAAMYGTPEWVTKLVAAGLWSTEQAGYRDVKYFAMGNPPAEKMAARRKADADRKARWREKRDRSRRDETRDSSVSHMETDGVTPFSPSLPPLKGEGERAPAMRGAAPLPNGRHPPLSVAEDPKTIAADEARLVGEAEAAERALQAERERTSAHVAAAKELIKKSLRGVA